MKYKFVRCYYVYCILYSWEFILSYSLLDTTKCCQLLCILCKIHFLDQIS